MMPMIHCPKCKKKISEKADKCPHCGYPVKRNEKLLIAFCAVVSLVCGLMIAHTLVSLFQQRNERKAVTELPVVAPKSAIFAR